MNLLGPKTVLEGGFELLERASRGAQATVFKARQVDTGRDVAVKLVSGEGRGFSDQVKRLENEFAMLRSLTGLPAFLEPVAFEAKEDYAFLAMEWIDGTVDGAKFIEQNNPMQVQTWLWVAKTLTIAVLECHRRGLLHRDIKPRNVLIAPSGVLKLIDFGIAHDQGVMALGENDINLGTLPYVPPEQVAKGEVGVPGEIFALGVTLYEFLTSTVPFKADAPGEIMRLKTSGRFVPPSRISPDFPEWVDRLLNRMLDARPERRPQGAREVLSLLTVGADAVAETAATSLRVCRNCGEGLWRELPFCSHCGTAYRLKIGRGPQAVVAHRIDRPEDVVNELERGTGQSVSAADARRFSGPFPRVLVDGIDEESASFIADALTSDGSVFRPETVSLLDRLSMVRLSIAQSAVAAVMIVVLVATVFLMPFSSLADGGIFSMAFGRSALLILLCLVVIGFVVREAFAPMVGRGLFSVKRRKRAWKGLGEIRDLLSCINDEGLRRRASALVRRVTLLVDHIEKQKLSPTNRSSMVDNLDRLTREGLSRLLKLDEAADAMVRIRTSGISRLRASLEKSLSSAREPVTIDRLTGKLAEVEKLASVERTVARNSTLDEAVFSDILSEINSLHVTMNHHEPRRWQADLVAAAGRYADERKGGNEQEVRRA